MAEYFFVLIWGRITSMTTNTTPPIFFLSMHVQKNFVKKNNFRIFSKLFSLNKFFFKGFTVKKIAYLESARSI